MKNLKIIKNMLLYGAVIIVCVVFLRVWSTCENTEIKIGQPTEKIEKTPVHVSSLKAIGQWEFLSVQCDEVVDTIRKGFLSDDALTRIYHGTLRLGVDMKKIRKQNISYNKKTDKLTITLPKVALLDKKFIDEANTDSYFESGKWSEQAKKELLKKAEAKMRKRALTKANIKKAEDGGRATVQKMFLAMGYKAVDVKFEK